MATGQSNPQLTEFKRQATEATARIEALPKAERECAALQLLKDMRAEQMTYPGSEHWQTGDVFVRVHRIVRKAVIGF